MNRRQHTRPPRQWLIARNEISPPNRPCPEPRHPRHTTHRENDPQRARNRRNPTMQAAVHSRVASPWHAAQQIDPPRKPKTRSNRHGREATDNGRSTTAGNNRPTPQTDRAGRVRRSQEPATAEPRRSNTAPSVRPGPRTPASHPRAALPPTPEVPQGYRAAQRSVKSIVGQGEGRCRPSSGSIALPKGPEKRRSRRIRA